MDFNEALEKLDNVMIKTPNLYEFEVRVIEQLEKTVYVMATDYDDAEAKVNRMIADGEIDLEMDFDNFSMEYETECCDPDYEEDE